MKFSNIFFLAILLTSAFIFESCDDEPFGPTVALGNIPNISAPSSGESYEVTEDNLESLMTIVSWSAADFGYNAAITYILEVDFAGNAFANAVTLAQVSSLEANLTNGNVNNILLAKGAPGGEAVDIEIRVRAKVSDDVAELVSEPVSLTITTLEVIIDYPLLFIPGDYQGWAPEDSTTIIYSLDSDKKYEGFIWFTIDDALFKFTDGPSWDVNWGDVELDGILDPGGIGNDIPSGGPVGMYRLQADINALTYNVNQTMWGVVGDATAGGWDNDLPLEYDESSGVLSLTTDLNVGELKFRANGADDIAFGDSDGNFRLEYDGGNISVPEAGNYTIQLILNQANYAYKLTKN